ncbi:MAG TPA: hypothetical protein VIM70_12370 [Clostridium sp.]|uniref:hypothetical protein n=1 Tax=Clostridium sp. TaxID=1506 RepID=UPI002F94A26A
MLSYQINLSNQTLTVSDMSRVIYQELGFTSTNAEILYNIAGKQDQGFMYQDHLEVYIIKRQLAMVA